MEKPLGVLRHIPVIRSLKRLAKVSAWLLGIAGTLIAGAFLVFTFLILPRLDHYRPDLERAIGQTVGRKVTIGRLSGYWEGVAPRLDLHHLSIADPSGSPLTFDQVSIVPSWLSLAVFEARLALIEVHGPSINVRRDTDGQIYLNGFRLAGKGGNGNAGNWLLRQGHISIVDARISWEDKLFGMPRLTLDQGRLDFTSGLLGHHLSLFGRPPATIGDSVELVGDWRGDDLQHWNKWNGSLTSTLHGAKVSAWNRYMQSFGLVRSGEGDGSISVTFADGHINSLVADVKVKNAAYTLPGASELTLPAFGGRLQVDRGGDIYRITASRLTLMSASGPIFDNSSISGFWNAGRVGGGELQVDNVNLSYLQPLLHALGVDRNPLFARFAPGGQLKNLSVQWDGKIEAPTRYRIESGFTRLSWNPFGQVPGVRGVAGKASFDQNGGTLTLTGADEVRMPNVFPRPLHFTALDADVSWKNSAAGIALRLSRIRFANDDMHGQLSGTYRRHGAGAGTIDLAGSVDRVAATRVVDYLPYQAGQDTLRWLTMALKGGTLQNTRLRLSGDLDHFPFKGGKGGVFEVGGDVHDGRLLFDKDWPELDGIEARLQFRNERMDVLPTRASTLGMSLSRVKVSIPDLSAAVAQLQIDGHAEGDLAHMLRYTTKSPVDGWLGGFTGKVRADGRAMLDLGLIVPLSGNNDARVKGRVQFLGNRLDLTSLPLPTLDAVTGALDFTERGVASRGVRLRAFGGPFTLTASTDAAGHMHFGVDGQADSAKVIGRYVPQLASHVSGQSRYQARFSIHDGLEFLQIGSSMAGSRLDAPPPLGKPAAASMPLNVTLIPFTHASGARLDFSLGRQLSGRLRLDSHGDAQAAVIALGRPLGALPASGVTIKAALPVIDLQTWGDWMQSHSAGAPTTPLHVELATPELRWGSYVIHGASIWVGHEPADTHWHVMVDAAEIKGEIDYDTSDNGAIRARLPLLVLTPLAPGQSAVPSLSQYKVHSLPGLDVRVGKLVYRGITLGSLNLFARYSDRDWLLDNISLKTPEGTLSGSVRVHGATASVESRFLASATDIGKLLARFGVKDSFERGHGTIAGSLAWPGGLADFDLARVSGQLSTSLADGRFAKINPGVARLLGVLSLQSLPRRIHLDFTDVFSEGFTFDSLKGDANITQGVFHTGNVEMKGPGADVSIRGDINLAAETQQLAVHVEPHLSESVALATGAALINPVVGVAALAAQKVLRDPVSKIFSVDYNVSGTFAEPQVTRVSRPVVKNPTRKTPR